MGTRDSKLGAMSTRFAHRAASLVLAAVFFVTTAAPTHALTVFDPTNYAQAVQAFKQATDALKTARDSLSVVTSTLREVRSIVSQGQELLRFLGDPQAILRQLGFADFIGQMRGMVGQVTQTIEFGRKTFDQVCRLADETKSLTDAGANIFGSGRDLALEVNGQARNTRQYRPFAILEASFGEAKKAETESKTREKELMTKLGALMQRAKDATTQTEIQALQAQISTVKTMLEAVRHETQDRRSSFNSHYQAWQIQRVKEREADEESGNIIRTQASSAAVPKLRSAWQALSGE